MDEDKQPSGKWVQRVPRSLHAKLQRIADAEGVSMNHLCIYILAHAVGAYLVIPMPQQPVSEPAKETEHESQ